MYYTSNTGGTWTSQSTTSKSWNCLACSSNGLKVYAGTQSGDYIFLSIDGGATWSQSGSTTGSWQAICCSSDGTRIYAVQTSAVNAYYSTDSGASWNILSISGTRNIRDISCSGDGKIIAAAEYSGYIWISYDYGSSWTYQTTPGSASWRSAAVSRSSGFSMAFGLQSGTVWKYYPYQETFTVGNASVSNTGDYELGTTLANTLANIVSSYNAKGGNCTAIVPSGSSTTIVYRANASGSSGNSLVSTETKDGANIYSFTGSNLSGGSDGGAVITMDVKNGRFAIGNTSPTFTIEGATIALAGSGLSLSSTYQKMVMYVDTTNNNLIELARSADSSTGARLPLNFAWRGAGSPAFYFHPDVTGTGSSNAGFFGINADPAVTFDVAMTGGAASTTHISNFFTTDLGSTYYTYNLIGKSGSADQSFAIGYTYHTTSGLAYGWMCMNGENPTSASVRYYKGGFLTVTSLSGTGNRAVYSDTNGQLTNTSSDISLKTNVETITSTLDIMTTLKALRGVYFNWIPEQQDKLGSAKELGMIAQEVSAAGLPEIVGTNQNGLKSLDYAKIVAFLVEVCKNLVTRIETLENK